MPFDRQLWTVEIGHSIAFAVAVVPPRKSITEFATVLMAVDMRQSQTVRKAKVCDNRNCDNRRAALHAMMDPSEIKAELTRRNMTQRDLAEAIGLSENYLSKALSGKRQFKPAELDAIRAELAPDEAVGPRIRTIPLLGAVPAGRPSPEQQRAGRQIAVSDPSTPANAYALTVKGDSMDLIVPNGTTLIIDPDDKNLWPGKRYVVMTSDGETTFKEYQEEPARLSPCSSNPEHREIQIGHEPITILGRVYSYTMRDADLPRRRPS